jgi:hypothetical protein
LRSLTKSTVTLAAGGNFETSTVAACECPVRKSAASNSTVAPLERAKPRIGRRVKNRKLIKPKLNEAAKLRRVKQYNIQNPAADKKLETELFGMVSAA